MATVHTLARATAQGGASVSISGLSLSYGANRVLDALDLTIDSGQFVSIVGRSGCGKSTLLRAITALETPDTGGIETDRARTRVVFQEPRLLPWSDVRANVEVGADGDAADRRAQADEALELVGLSDKAGEWPARLSGGQRQRVALARALVSRPRLLLLDEPLGALDALTRIEMQRLLERVWLRQGFTALLVTHDVAEAVALGDRVVMMEHGRITRDIAVTAERPRRHADAALARVEAEILGQLLAG
ncbi:MAG: ABC transporter ATP-binding protein [Sphingomonas adhaesiva]|uniref:ABC transporter ATP-binding protein n=1 Tax=Sphingomonas adhaesiva TaxID=28212 RepID=UPI002FFA3EE8